MVVGAAGQNIIILHTYTELVDVMPQSNGVYYYYYFYIINKKKTNQHIRLISEGSCNTDDWSNNAENSDLFTEINYIFKYIHIENSYLKW